MTEPITEPTADDVLPARVPLVLHVIPTGTPRGAQREARALADELDAPGSRHHRVLSLFDGGHDVEVDVAIDHPARSAAGTGFDIGLLRVLRSELRRMDPTVVVAHGSEPLKYLVPAMAGRRRPLAYYAIGTYSGSRGRVQVELWRRLVGRADVVAAEGEEVRDECVDLLGIDPGRVHVTPNGRDPAVFRPGRRPTAGEPGGPATVTFVGAFTEGKGPDRFIEVIAALRRAGTACRAVMIGDGPLRDQVAGPARRADVELLGTRDDVADLLSRSSVLVFPSRPAGEGMPGVLIEAGLCGLACVTTDVPGVRSIVVDGTTGLVVPVDDVEAMAAATRHLLENPTRCRTMGDAARRRCLERFSLTAVGRRWLELLAPLCDRTAT